MNRQLSLAPTPEDKIWEIVSSEEYYNNSIQMRTSNKSAGVRLRKQLAEIVKLAKQSKKESMYHHKK